MKLARKQLLEKQRLKSKKVINATNVSKMLINLIPTIIVYVKNVMLYTIKERVNKYANNAESELY